MKALRTKCYGDQSTKEVQIKMDVQRKNNGEYWLYIVEGGVTGYESIQITEYNIRRLCLETDWPACAGTQGSWDKLVVPKETMRRFLQSVFTIHVIRYAHASSLCINILFKNIIFVRATMESNHHNDAVVKPLYFDMLYGLGYVSLPFDMVNGCYYVVRLLK